MKLARHANANQKIFVIVLAFLLVSSCASRESEKRPPNIIYILADDLGYGDLGCYGQRIIETPNIDRLARGGMKFTQHYAGAPVCAPSRCVLLTGLHLGHSYIRGNDEWSDRGKVWDFRAMEENPNLEGQRPIPAHIPTLGSALQSAGYRTGIVGKWGLGSPTSDGIPNNRGFDFFFGYNCQRQAHMLYPKHLWRNKERVELTNTLIPPKTLLDSAADPGDPESYSKYIQNEFAPELMQREALQFIEQNNEKPFFLYYATPIPHLPLQMPFEYVRKYVDKLGDEAPYLGEEGYYPNRYPHATYAAMVNYLDDQVGEIMEKLKELGIDDNTLVIFSSDNGPAYNAGTDSPFFGSGGPFKSEYGWGKGFVHEGGIRVPMIAYWKGKIEPATVSDHISGFQDVLPTIADLIGFELKSETDGISFLPELIGESSTQKQHEFLYWEFPEYNGQQALRMGKWKAIRKDLHDGNLKIALYNLETDPQEQSDLSEQFPDVVSQIETIMAGEHRISELEKFKISVLDTEAR